VEERKFLGFRLNRELRIGSAPESIERLKAKVRELWNARQSLTSTELRNRWQRFIRGWWEYYRLAEEREPIHRLEGWIRRHIGKCFWLRWHNKKGRLRQLRNLGIKRDRCSSGLQCTGSVASRGSAMHAEGAEQRGPSTNRFPDAIRSCGDELLSSPPDAENRTSGGVGGAQFPALHPIKPLNHARASPVGRLLLKTCTFRSHHPMLPAQSFSSCRAITSRWISLVPSPIVQSFTSR